MLKTFRDIRETIGSFISILIVIFVGCFFFAGIAEGSSAVTAQVDDFCVSQNLAAARAEYMYVNSAAVGEIAQDERVEKAAGYDTFYTNTAPYGIRYDMTITTITEGIDDPYMVKGRLPDPGAGEIIIDEVFSEAHGVGVGAELEFYINTLKSVNVGIAEGGTTPRYEPAYESVPYTFTVCGIFHSPDVIYKVNFMNTADVPENFIMAYVNYGEIASYKADAVVTFNGMPVFSYSAVPDDINIYNGIKILGEYDGDDDEELFSAYSVSSAEELTEIFRNPSNAAGLYMYTLEQKNFPSLTAYDSINDTIAALAAVLPMIFFAVAAAITVISLSKTVENQRMQIGVIQALGISKSNVYFSYIFYALFACLIGGLVGGVVGNYTVPFLLTIIYARQFSMPPTPLHIGVAYMLLGVLIAAALASLSAFLSCYKTLRQKPAQAMRPKPPKKTRRILAERWTGLWKRLGFGAKMNLRNMFLHKMKMLLSSVGIIGCLALLVGLIGLKDNMAFSFDSYENSSGYDLTIVTSVAADIESDSPIYDEIAGVDGAEYMHNLTFVPDFSARFQFNGNTADQTLMALPTYADEKYYRFADADCIKLYTDLYGRNRLLFVEDTFAIPKSLADKLGVKAGDTVSVSGYTLDNTRVEFDVTVTAVVYEYFDQKAYCSYDLFKTHVGRLVADTSYATLLPGADRDEAIAALEKNEYVRAVSTFRDAYDTLSKQMGLLDYAVIIFVVGAAVLAIAVIYNITSTNLKERTREIATLMVLGYKKHETASMVLVENMFITGLGCLLGLPLGYGLLYWLVDITASFNVFISGFLSWYVALGCIALTFIFSVAATLLLKRGMDRISMVEALKSVE